VVDGEPCGDEAPPEHVGERFIVLDEQNSHVRSASSSRL
jgi:hypothetical protein